MAIFCIAKYYKEQILPFDYQLERFKDKLHANATTTTLFSNQFSTFIYYLLHHLNTTLYRCSANGVSATRG